MNEASQTYEAGEGGEAVAAPLSAGHILAQMRQAAGVHIAALATTLKVSVDKLEALEADRYDLFSDVVFMRALAAGVCRTLKQDPAPVLALLPGAAPAPLRIGKGINASFKDTGHRGGSFGGAGEPPRSRLLGVAVVLLLAAALAVALWPGRVGFDGASPAAQSALAPQPAPGTDEQPAVAGEGQPPAQAPAESTAAVPTPAAPAPAAEPASAALAATAPAATAPAAVASAAAPEAEHTLVIRASAPSWVQVRGSGGAVVLQKTLAAGESAPVPGTPPWSVVVGKADVTQVIVRGKPLDLAALARENVARFEVK